MLCRYVMQGHLLGSWKAGDLSIRTPIGFGTSSEKVRTQLKTSCRAKAKSKANPQDGDFLMHSGTRRRSSNLPGLPIRPPIWFSEPTRYSREQSGNNTNTLLRFLNTLRSLELQRGRRGLDVGRKL